MTSQAAWYFFDMHGSYFTAAIGGLFIFGPAIYLSEGNMWAFVAWSAATLVVYWLLYWGLMILIVITDVHLKKLEAREAEATKAAAAAEAEAAWAANEARMGRPTMDGRHLDYRPPVGRERKRLRKERAASQVQS